MKLENRSRLVTFTLTISKNLRWYDVKVRDRESLPDVVVITVHSRFGRIKDRNLLKVVGCKPCVSSTFIDRPIGKAHWGN